MPSFIYFFLFIHFSFRMSHHKSYRLVYFDAEGRGEFIRLIFHHFKTQFDDIRLTAAEWEKKKASKQSFDYQSRFFCDSLSGIFVGAPFESLPILEMDNGKKVLGDSIAIARYLSKTLGEGLLILFSHLLKVS